MSAPRVRIHVDTITLRGFAMDQREGLIAGFRAELERLLARAAVHGGLTQGYSKAAIDGGRLHLEPGTPPVAIGRAAAGRIAGSLRS